MNTFESWSNYEIKFIDYIIINLEKQIKISQNADNLCTPKKFYLQHYRLDPNDLHSVLSFSLFFCVTTHYTNVALNSHGTCDIANVDTLIISVDLLL